MSGRKAARSNLKRDESALRQKIKPGTAKRVLAFALPHAGLMALFLLVAIASAGIGVAIPLIFRKIIDDGIPKGNVPLILDLGTLAAVLGLFDGVLYVAQRYLPAKIGANVVFSLRTRLFEHIQRMPLAFFARAQTGALVTRLHKDLDDAQLHFTAILGKLAQLIGLTLMLGAMFTLSWRITLAALALFPPSLLPWHYLGRTSRSLVRQSSDVTAEMNNLMVERFNVAGALLVKLFGRRDEECSSFADKAARVSDIGLKQVAHFSTSVTPMLAVIACATALTYGWGGILAVRHSLDVGGVVALAAYMAQFYPYLLSLSSMQLNTTTVLVSCERAFEVLDLSPAIQDKPGAVPIPPGQARIAFENVSFHYPAAKEISLASLESVAVPEAETPKTVLREISFEVQPGQLIALVGPSGAGKTTITHLAPRLYDVQNGAVRINGIDVRDARLDSLSERIGVVTQDAHFFHDTIRANLLYAKPDATDEEMWDALRDAQILELIESLPDGLDTLVGERGYRFSGGEKQRIAIARLLLRAPDIVILDEATAHLDSESEAAIQKALETALVGRTSIVIAHRLSTVVKADQILVVQDGAIVQRGTHAELINEEEIYAELYQRPFSQMYAGE